jgi:hypothetical protein
MFKILKMMLKIFYKIFGMMIKVKKINLYKFTNIKMNEHEKLIII